MSDKKVITKIQKEEPIIVQSDEELTSLLAKHNRSLKLGNLAIRTGCGSIIIGAIGAFLASSTPFIILLLVGFVLVFAGIGPVAKGGDAIKKLLSANVLPPIMDQYFASWEHHADERIPDAIVRQVDMGLPAFDKVHGSDFVQAVYKGLNMTFSNLSLTQVEEKLVERDDGNGGTEMVHEEVEHTVFVGQWIICDFAKPITADLLLAEREEKTKTPSTVETENGEFNRKFLIRSADAHTAFYILTPHMMEYILQMDENANARTYIRFTKEGKVHIALHTSRTVLNAIQVKTVEDLTKIRQTYAKDLEAITHTLDELLKNESMFYK